MIEIVYDLEREDSDEPILLLVNGDYAAGEPEEKWGYYGATPGTPDEVWIEDIRLMIPGDAFKYKDKYYDLISWDGKLTPGEESLVLEMLMERANDEKNE